MTEYLLRPSKKTPPLPQDLLDDLHKRGWQVELNLKAENGVWEDIRFFRPGPPEEIECFLLHDPEALTYIVSLPAMPANGAQELQFHVLDILLNRLGGAVEDYETHRTLTQSELEAWARKYKSGLKGILSRPTHDLFWFLFPWVVSVGGILYSIFGNPVNRLPALLVTIPALLSAIGMTFFAHKD